MTIKDSLKKLKTLVAVIGRDQKIVCEKEDRYQDGLAVTEELRQEDSPETSGAGTAERCPGL